MSVNVNFLLEIQLATAFHCWQPITLDGLLSSAVFQLTGIKDHDEIEKRIPLTKEDGIFKASSLFLDKRYQIETVDRIMSLRGDRDLHTSLFKPNRRDGTYGFIDKKRGNYKSNISAYPGFLSPSVSFFGQGDPERVVELIETLPGIGRRTNAGAGEILSVRAIEIADDHAWISEKGTPNRPLPVALWDKLNTQRRLLPVKKMAVTFPYWKSTPVDAVAPGFQVAPDRFDN